MASKTAVALRNTMLDQHGCNNGYLRIYGGAVPADADAALGGATLLAELRMNATAFPGAAAGVLTANAITSDASADATGTATFFRILASDGTTVKYQGAVGTAGAELNLNTTSIVAAAQVDVTALTVTLAA